MYATLDEADLQEASLRPWVFLFFRNTLTG